MNDNLIPNKKFRRPIHPGLMLAKEFLDPLGVSPARFADHVGVPVDEIETFVRGERDLTTTLAIRIGNAVGTSVQMWLNMQMACDLYDAMQSPGGDDATRVKPLPEVEAEAQAKSAPRPRP